MSRATWIKLVVLGLLIVGLLMALRTCCGFNVLLLTPEKVRAFVLSFGAWAPIVYLAVYAQPLVPLPATVMAATAGLAFGTTWGALAAVTGATLRACTQFCIARLVGQDAIKKLFRGNAIKLYRTTGRIGFKTVLLIRVLPNFPYDVQNYALGFSEVRFAPYLMGTILGIAPASIAFVYFGYSITDVRQLWKMFLAMLVIVGLVAAQRVWAAKRQPPSAAP